MIGLKQSIIEVQIAKMTTNAELRLRNESKGEADEETVSLRRCLDRIRESLDRLGSAVNSSGSMILRLEEDLLDQRNSVEIIETRLLKVEEQLIGATGEMHLDEASASGESPSVVESDSLTPTEAGNDVDDEANTGSSTQIANSSNSTKLLQKSIAGTTDSQKKKKSISNRSSDSLDFDLLKIVFQCVMSLSQASRARQVESSCRLIQRIFRGYVVRRSFNVSRLKRSEESLAISPSEDVDQVFPNDNEDPPSTETEVSVTSSTVTPKNDDDVSNSGVETAIQDESNRKSKQSLKSSLAKLMSTKHSHQRQDAHRQPQPQPQQLQQPRASLPSILPLSLPSSSPFAGGRRSWSVSGTSAELNDADDGFVRDRRELHQLQTFLFSKISGLRKKHPSVPDVIFIQTLEEIHSQLITTSKNPSESTDKTPDVNYSYKDLMSNFEAVLDEKLSQQIAAEQFINAFRAILNEFLKKKSQRKDSSNDKPKKETLKKQPKTMQAISESAAAAAAAVVEGGVGQVTFQSANRCSSSAAPEFVAQLMDAVESRGLSVVGIYRVAGNNAKIKQLIKDIDSQSVEVDFSVVDIHVMASVLKSFLRNLPQPLIACHVYEELSHLPNWSKVTLNDVTAEERTRMLNDLYNKLLPHHQKLLDRLLSHLARVALNESVNKMSANALAITFTPCLLRLPSENSLSIEALKTPVQRQTEFVQSLIEAKLQELKKAKEEEEQGPEMNSPDADDVSVDLVSTSGASDDVIEEENHSHSNDVISTELGDDVVDDAFAADDDIDADHVLDSSSTDEETSGAPNDLRPL